MLWIRLFTQLSSMAANALSAPQKCKHLPWQRSQHQTLLKRSRSRLQSLGTHSLGTECHFIEGMNITRVIRTTTQWILHLVCQEHPEKHMFLAYLTREAPTISYLSAALTCFGSTLILSVISKTFTASTFIFPWTTNDDKSPSAIHGLFWIRLCHVLLLSQPAFLKDLRIS